MATYIVDNASDVVDGNYGSGNLSLREAIIQANAAAGADTITFAASLAGQTITLTGGQLTLTNDLTIDGDVNGDNKADIIISGNDASRVFHITGTGTDVELDSLTLTNGNPGASQDGGAILTGAGTTLAITDSTIKDSATSLFGDGAGIYSGGTLTVTGSTISGNTGAFHGGGVFLGVEASGTFTNTTIDGNSAIAGGGIYTIAASTLTILNSTITENHAAGSDGGGIFVKNGIHAYVTNSVIALNTADFSGPDFFNGGGLNSYLTAGYSFFGSTVSIDTQNGQNINGGGDPRLAALADNGGPVATRSIRWDSHLIDAGSDSEAAGLTIDANGNPRFSGVHVDIGATEVQQLVVTTAADVVDAGDGVVSLREAVALANAAGAPQTIFFDPSLAGDTITLTSGELALTNDVTIAGDVNGDHKADITISGGGASRIFNVSGSGTDVELDGLTLTSGHSAGQRRSDLYRRRDDARHRRQHHPEQHHRHQRRWHPHRRHTHRHRLHLLGQHGERLRRRRFRRLESIGELHQHHH